MKTVLKLLSVLVVFFSQASDFTAVYLTYHTLPDEPHPLNEAPAKHVSCTSQLIKVGGRCYLISTDHCQASGHTKSSLYCAKENKNLSLKNLRKSSALDLREYEVPAELKEDCEALLPLDKRIVSTQEALGRKDLYSFKLKGFVNHQYREEFSSGEDWARGGYAYAYIDLLPMGAVDWFELDKVQMFPGMSGGVAESIQDSLVGMLSSYIYMQDVSIVVPYASIVRFLQTSELTPRSSGWSIHRQKSSLQPAADNLLKGGGGNEHGKGAGNEHSKGHDWYIAQRQEPLHVLEMTQEPDEGVVSPANSNLRILGIGGEQVDGWDDYYSLSRSSDLSKVQVVTRENSKSSYPDLKIRKKILDRFDGYYSSILTMESQKHLIFVPDNQNPLGWRIGYSALPLVDINIEGDTISFSTGIHGFTQRGRAVQGFLNSDPIPKMQMKEDIFLKLVFDSEYKTMQLSGRQYNLNSLADPREFALAWTCKNQQYLKIICESRGNGQRFSNLSLSKSSEGDHSVLRFRLTYFETINQVPVYHYYYGTALKSVSTRQMRKAHWSTFPYDKKGRTFKK